MARIEDLTGQKFGRLTVLGKSDKKKYDNRRKVKTNLPHCDECDMCILVGKEKQDGYRRLCIEEMRLIEQKVSNSPHWCRKRMTG